MRKRILLLTLSGFLLSSCGGQANEDVTKPPVDQGGSGENNEGNNNNENDDNKDPDDDKEEIINPDITPFEKISELTSYLSEEVPSKEKEASSYKRELVNGENSLYSFNTETIKEEGRSYFNDTIVVSGTSSIFKDYPEDDYFEDETIEDEYQGITSLKDKVFYDVIDFKNDNERDESYKEAFDENKAQTYMDATNVSVSKDLNKYFDNYVKGRYLINGSSDKVTSTVNTKDGSFETSFSLSKDYSDDYGDYIEEVSVTLNFLKDGALAGYFFEFSQYSYLVDADNNPTDQTFLIASLSDKVTLSYEDKVEYDFASINPLDYFMTSFDVTVCSFDTIMSTSKPEDINAFPYNEYVTVQASNVLPEKSIDREIKIISSSNQEVIKPFADQYKAIGEGKTTLTVESTYGIKKEVEVTVVAPELETVTPRFTSSLHFVGQEDTLYLDYEPENTLDEYYFVNKNEDVVETSEIIGNVEGTDCIDLTYLKAGTVTLEFYRKKDDKLLNSITFEVIDPLDDETMKTNLLGEWYGDLEGSNGSTIKEAVKIEFVDESNAILTILKEDTAFTLEVNKPYKLTYEHTNPDTGEGYNGRKDRMEFSFSPISFNVGNQSLQYDDNDAYFYRDGKTLNISFKMSDQNYYGFTLEFDAYRK